MRAAFSNELVRLAKADPNVLLLTGDHGYALFDEFRRECPGQYLNCGIAEQNMVGMAAGLAKAGFRPFVYGLAAFIPIRVIEQIKLDIAHDNLPIVLIGDGAGLVYGHLGPSHQSTEDIACVRAIPNITILSPSDQFEMTACMGLANELLSPVYLRMGKSDLGNIHPGSISLTNGELVKVKSGKKSIAFIATGSMVKTAIELSESGLDAEVWSAPTIKPICEEQLIKITKEIGIVVTLEEHSTMGGLGSIVTEVLSEKATTKIFRIGINDKFSENCGTWDHLLKTHKLSLKTIQNKINLVVDTKVSERIVTSERTGTRCVQRTI